MKIRQYYELCKPRVVMLIVFTAIAGMLLAGPGFPSLLLLLWATLGIALQAGAAAALNQIIDRKLDADMVRTRNRPLVTGALGVMQSSIFAALLGLAGFGILWELVNPLTAVLTLLTLIGYAGVYTLYLKRATPHNIVIGGAAGAAPPLLGWTAMTGTMHADAFLLFLIIFLWTPPHFWALAIDRHAEYARVGIPMLPVTHGIEFTKTRIIVYTVLLCAASLLPFASGMSGWLYLPGALLLDGIFLNHVIRLKWFPVAGLPMKTFGYSIIYLSGIFTLLLADHFLSSLAKFR